MSKVKIKVRKGTDGNNGAQIMSMFNMMSGSEDAEPRVIIPKICKVRNKIRHILKVLNQFATAKFMLDRFERYSSQFKQILQFCDDCKKDLMLQDSDDTEDYYKDVPKQKINLLYRGIKNGETVQQVMIMTSVLKKFKLVLENYDKTKENFINTEPGSRLFLFRFSDLDFKILWADPNMDTQMKLYVATVLKLLYQDGTAIYDTITSADIDPEEFASVMSNALSQMENQREIASCRDAFRAIRESTTLLKEKMNDYYRESVIAENPNLMFTSFLSDVINSKVQGEGKTTDKIRAQFMRICGFIQKQSQKRGINDPIMKKMMGNVQTMYKASKTKNVDVKKSIIARMSGINVDTDMPDLSVPGASLFGNRTEEIKVPERKSTPSDSKSDDPQNANGENSTGSPLFEIDQFSDEPLDEIVLDESDEELLREDEEQLAKATEVPLTAIDLSTNK